MKKILHLFFLLITGFTFLLVSQEKVFSEHVPSVPDDFTWDMLDTDDVNLSTYKKQDVYTPIKLEGSFFEDTKRDYYLFNGIAQGVYDVKTSKYSFNDQSDINKQIGGIVKNGPLLQPNIYGASKTPGADGKIYNITTYFRFNSSSYSDGLGFDIGEMSSPSGPIETSRKTATTNPARRTYVTSVYTKKNEIIHYGYMDRAVPTGYSSVIEPKIVDYQPVRVRTRVADEKSGTVRTTITFYNKSSTTKYYAPLYGIHLDIGGAHQDSRLFSNGPSGVYFNETGERIEDKLPFNLFYFMNGEGTNYYNDNPGPNSIKTGNLNESTRKNHAYIGGWNIINIGRWTNRLPESPVKEPYLPGSWELPEEQKGFQYPLSHPIIALRWDPIEVEAGGVSSFDFDQSFSEGEIIPNVKKSFINKTTKDNKKNKRGNIVSFNLEMENVGAINWKNVNLTDVIPEGLDIQPDTIYLTGPGKQVTKLDPSVYNTDTKTLSAGPYTIENKQKFIVSFDAKISSSSEITITNKMKVTSDNANTEFSSVDIPLTKDDLVPLKIEFVDNNKEKLKDDIIVGNYEIGTEVDLSKNDSVQTAVEDLLNKGYQVDRPKNESEIKINEENNSVTYLFNGPAIPGAKKSFENLTTKNNDKNSIGDLLRFKLEANNLGKVEWNNVKITDEISKFLTVNSTNIKLIDEEGNINSLPSSVYNEKTATLTVDNLNIKANKKVIVIFEAKITNTSESIINNEMIAYSNSTLKANSSVDIPISFKYPLKVKFLDDSDETLESDILVDEYFEGTEVNLVNNASVQSTVTAIIDKGYTVTRPDNEGAVIIKNSTTEVTYVFTKKGSIDFISAPSNIDFGSIKYKAQNIDEGYKKVTGNPLIVSDTRNISDKKQWNIQAKVTIPMTLQNSSKDFSLKNALYYQKGNDLLPLNNDNGQLIFSKTDGGSQNISDLWSEEGDGPRFKVGANEDMRIGDYEGEITWTLEVSP